MSKLPFLRVINTLLAVATLASACIAAHAQGTSAGPRAVGVSILHLNISKLDQSLALYRDVLGMEVVTPPAQPRSMPNLVSEPGALLRTAVLKAPGGPFQMELVEWTGIAVKPQQARIQDPGAVMLAMTVPSVDALMPGIKKLGLKVLTQGGAPVADEIGGKRTRTVVVRDADGFVLELMEGGTGNGNTAPSISNVSVYLTVHDLAQTVAFYNQAFGFNMPTAGEARPIPERIHKLLGDKSLTTMRIARGTFPGSEFQINFQELGGPTTSRCTIACKIRVAGC